jgi:hypothetical protein
VLDPLPAVPARIEPLGPALARAIPAAPTWEGFVQSFCPVRELSPGERPRDWVTNANDGTSSVEANDAGAGATPLTPERYKVQFTATEEYVRLIEEAKALLSHSAPRATLDEIHLRALRAFVSQLRKQKYATAEQPSRQTQSDVTAERPTAEAETEAPVQELRRAPDRTNPHHPRQRGRRIPAAVKRAVFLRDGEQCLTIIHISSSHRRRGVIKRPNGFAPIRSNAGTCKRHEYGLVRRRTPDETVAVDC